MPQQQFNLQKTFRVLYHFFMQDGSACIVDLSVDIYSVTLYEWQVFMVNPNINPYIYMTLYNKFVIH